LNVLDKAKFSKPEDQEQLQILMDGISGGFDLNYLIPDVVRVYLDVHAEGFSEYFT
jgi:hypothetical protein